MRGVPVTAPDISIVILNYNARAWIPRCLESIARQTIFSRLEVIFVDNASQDGSLELAREIMRTWSNAVIVDNGANLGFCEGNNRGARVARGRFLFFLNPDTWLEPDCMEQLLEAVTRLGAGAATPMILEYDSDEVQSAGGGGFDIFGFMSMARPKQEPYPVLVAGGSSFFIRRELFERIGGFDSAFFMYAEEYDLSWRVWLAGEETIVVPRARIHHRGAVCVNPKGGTKIVEIRTSVQKRFYTNRNGLLVLLKNCTGPLLVLVPLQVAYLLLEGIVWALLSRSWTFFKHAYLRAFVECWNLRGHVQQWRRMIASYRQRSDLFFLRFFRLRLNRYDELIRVFKLGLPKVDHGGKK